MQIWSSTGQYVTYLGNIASWKAPRQLELGHHPTNQTSDETRPFGAAKGQRETIIHTEGTVHLGDDIGGRPASQPAPNGRKDPLAPGPNSKDGPKFPSPGLFSSTSGTRIFDRAERTFLRLGRISHRCAALATCHSSRGAVRACSASRHQLFFLPMAMFTSLLANLFST
jgi:hypothetical protein